MIAYPSQLDNFLKSQCAIKGSGHYMDDFYNLVPPNRNCREILSAMFAQAEKNKFTFNPDKTRYIHLDRPFRYCKTKYFLTESGHVVMRANRNILKLRRIFYSIFGFSCESIENFREKDRNAVCNDKTFQAAKSAAAHKYFACDYDGKGFYRGKLSDAIVERLEPKNFDSPQERDEFWKKIWKNDLTQKYRRPEHLDYWLWNDGFFNAPIEDLEYIAELVGVKKGRLENV